METTPKEKEPQKRPPTQEEFWRGQNGEQDTQSRLKKAMDSLPPVVPFSYPMTETLPVIEPPPETTCYKPSLLRWLMTRKQ